MNLPNSTRRQFVKQSFFATAALAAGITIATTGLVNASTPSDYLCHEDAATNPKNRHRRSAGGTDRECYDIVSCHNGRGQDCGTTQVNVTRCTASMNVYCSDVPNDPS